MPDDAERLARYKAYARATINTRISSELRETAEEKTVEEQSPSTFSLLDVFEREVARLQKQKHNMTADEAMQSLFVNFKKQGSNASLSAHDLDKLETVLTEAQNLINKDHADEQELKDAGYEKSYMFKRVQRLLREKEG